MTVLDTDTITEQDDELLLGVLHAIQNELYRRDEAKLVTQIKELLAADEEMADVTVETVVFTTWDWDNGWFYYPHAIIKGTGLDDGEPYSFDDDHYDFNALDEVLADLSSLNSLGEHSTLTVNLKTGEIDPSD